MAKTDSVLDYNKYKVQADILNAFKQKRGEAAVADIVAYTGLPKPQVDAELPAVADEYSARLKVTGSGEILYSFPHGFKSRYRGFIPGLKKFSRTFLKVLGKVSTFLFKAWIMLMLVGYFALFVALIILAILASVALSAADKNGKSRSRGSIGSLGLATRLIDLAVRIWFYNEVFKGPGQRRYEATLRASKRENRRPLHRAIFSFVFGEPDPNANHGVIERQAFASLVRVKKGVIMLEDFMALSGLSPEEADTAINRYLYEFEGTPEVTEEGSIYYHFPKLLLRARSDAKGAADFPLKKIKPFSANAKKANMSYVAINGFNLLFGGYFLFNSFAAGSISTGNINGFNYLYYFTGHLLNEFGINALPVMAIGLGLVPMVFSVLFWLVPAFRSKILAKENELIKKENLQRIIYAKAITEPESLKVPDENSLPVVARPKNTKMAALVVEELAAYEEAEPAGTNEWHLKELVRKSADIEKLRLSIKLEDNGLGGIVFDSDS